VQQADSQIALLVPIWLQRESFSEKKKRRYSNELKGIFSSTNILFYM